MERFVVMLLLCIAPAAQAQHVYKCTQGKSVSYQSEPCAGAADRVWHAPPEVIDPAIQRQNQYTQQEMDRRAREQRSGYRAPSRATGASIGVSRNQSACDSAKARRAAAYEQLGTRRTFEQSRFWDNQVYDACK
ncbi:hypothetical protein ABB30_05000 [Stenotrophomonas ginsengisoli]|uniref:DUF4124 domain-containing protein n=1 Tax=Stenotrophomonas ginsengisoli TaxID=336566 RepID=A0A0R0DJG7_9GAMM|nr:hypothetical protein [Stenotrophomonas ginsengisoli]KRG78084.1 hypothetical protein ABB30_05000 [Stenotrophomonas ginsengisoli]